MMVYNPRISRLSEVHAQARAAVGEFERTVEATLPVGQRVEIEGGHWGTVVDNSMAWSMLITVAVDDLPRLLAAKVPVKISGFGERHAYVPYDRLILPLE